MNSKMETKNQGNNHFRFESEHETHGWKPVPLSQIAQESTDSDIQMEHLAPIVPEVSSLPPEVEIGLKALMGELGFTQNEAVDSTVISEESSLPFEDSDQAQSDAVLQATDYDIDDMLDTIKESDIPPLGVNNLVFFPGQHSPLPASEYSAIRRFYGPDFADQITTTPSLGATDSDIDVMMGRVSFTSDGTILLSYNDTSIPLRGVGVTPDLDGKVVLVKGFFIANDAFMVDQTIRYKAAKQEVR